MRVQPVMFLSVGFFFLAFAISSVISEETDGTPPGIDPNNPYDSTLDLLEAWGLPTGMQPIIWVDWFEFSACYILLMAIGGVMITVSLTSIDHDEYDADDEPGEIVTPEVEHEFDDLRKQLEALRKQIKATEREE